MTQILLRWKYLWKDGFKKANFDLKTILCQGREVKCLCLDVFEFEVEKV